MDRCQISRVKILALWAKRMQNGGEKVHVFCNGYNELALLCNGTDRHEIPAKTSIGVHYWTLIEEFCKFSLKGGDFALKPQFLGSFDGSPCYRPRSGITFFDLASDEGPTVCPSGIDFLCDLPFPLTSLLSYTLSSLAQNNWTHWIQTPLTHL